MVAKISEFMLASRLRTTKVVIYEVRVVNADLRRFALQTRTNAKTRTNAIRVANANQREPILLTFANKASGSLTWCVGEVLNTYLAYEVTKRSNLKGCNIQRLKRNFLVPQRQIDATKRKDGSIALTQNLSY